MEGRYFFFRTVSDIDESPLLCYNVPRNKEGGFSMGEQRKKNMNLGLLAHV
jgi:hypothetical protein